MNIMEPFRITVEHYDEKIIVEKSHSDISFDDYMEMLKKITGIIYTPEMWKEHFE